MPSIVQGTGTPKTLISGTNMGLTLNDLKVAPVLLGADGKPIRYSTSDPKQQLKMLEMQDVYSDKQNANLTPAQKHEFYTITKAEKTERIIASGGKIPTEEEGSKYKNDLIRELVELAPQLNKQQKIQVVNQAMEMRKARKREQQITQQALAAERTNQKLNVTQENRKALDDLLRDTSTVSTHFNNFISENFENVHNLSEQEIKAIEQQARENINKREDLTLEEKEKEYEKMKDEMQTKALEDKMAELEEMLKTEILDNPDEAREILGDKGLELLKQKLDQIQADRDAIYQEMLNMQKKKKTSSYEEFKRRRDAEMKNDLQNAIGTLYPGQANIVYPEQTVVPFVSRQARESELEREQIG